MDFLCILGVALLAIMLMGHGMWVAVAWVFRSLGGDEAAIDPGRACPHCGARYGVKQGRCVACGAVPRAAANKSVREDELQTTSRQLKRLCQEGAITPQQCDELIAVIGAELQQFAPLPKEIALRQPVAEPPSAGSRDSAKPVATQPEVIDAILVEPQNAPEQRAAIVANSNVHPLDRPYVPPLPKAPSQPGRSLADMLQSFMEESNIRWGEILAATLIVLCSVGLVISLRNTLKNIPYFPAILFTVFTVAFHGAGLYTLRRWKLQAVSRVILIISLLLVPLTFCGAIVLQQARPVTDPLFLVALTAGICIFTWVAYSASRELVGDAAWPLTIGVLGSSLAQVLIQRLDLAAGEMWRLNAAAGIPLISFLTATGWQLARARGWRQLSKQRVVQILRVLGIATFALLPPLALILVRGGPPAASVARLSPQFSLATAAVLAMGLLIHRRTTAKRLAGWQTVGTAILVLAAVLLILLVAAAWPDPETLLVLGLMNCAILAVLGLVAQLPLLYVPSVACAALATVIGWHLAAGHFADRSQLSLKVVQAALRGQTGLLLSMLGVVVAGLGGWLIQRKRSDEGWMLLISSAGLAVISLLIVLFSGFVSVPGWPQDRDLAAVILLLYVIALILAGPASRRPEIAGCGSLILWLAFVQSLAFNDTIRAWLVGTHWLLERPVLAATLLHGVITALVAAVATGNGAIARSPAARGRPLSLWERVRVRVLPTPEAPSRTAHDSGSNEDGAQLLSHSHLVADPLAIGAALSLILATPFIVWVRSDNFSASALMALIAASGWAAIAIGQRWPGAISALQTMLALGPALFIAGQWQAHDGGTIWFLNEQHLMAQLIAAALGTLIWSTARRLTSDHDVPRRLLNAPWPAVDQVLLGLATIALPVLVCLMTLPSIGWELGFASEVALRPGIATNDTLGALRHGWIALAVILAALAVSLWERITWPAGAGVGIATFAAVWLTAAHFDGTSAAATAARWAAAVYAIAWAGAFIAREPLRTGAKQIPTLRWDRIPPEASHWFGGQPLIFGGTTILILTILAVQQHSSGVTLRGPAEGTFFANIGPTASYVVPLAALVGVLLAYAIRERQAGFALGGAAVTQLAINLAYLLHINSAQPAAERAIEWLQWNSIAAGIYALVWLALARWITPQTAGTREKQIADGMWFVPVAISGIAAALLVGWAALAIAESPGGTSPLLLPLGSWLSYLAVGLVLSAAAWRSRNRLSGTDADCMLPLPLGEGRGEGGMIRRSSQNPHPNPLPKGEGTASPPDGAAQTILRFHLDIQGLGDVTHWLAMGIVPLVGASVSRLDPGGQWFSYHTLETGWLLVGAIACGFVCWPMQLKAPLFVRLTPHHLSVTMITGLAVSLAMLGNKRDPGQPWWSLGIVLAASAIFTAIGLARRSQPYAYASTALAGLAMAIFWWAPTVWPLMVFVFGADDAAGLAGLDCLMLTLTAASSLWLWREVESQRRLDQSFDQRTFLPRIHALVVAAALPCFFLYRAMLALSSLWTSHSAANGVVSVIAVVALGGLIAGMLWDRRAIFAIPLLYLWGGVVWLLAIELGSPWLPQQLAPRWHYNWECHIVLFITAMALHVALTGQLWSYGANLAALVAKLGVPNPVAGLTRTARWLPIVNLALATAICTVSCVFVLTLRETQLPFRVLAAWGPAFVAWGILCLAQERRRDALQLASLLVAGLSAIYLAWAQIEPDHNAGVWLTRVFRLLMVLAALTFVYGLALPRFLLTSGPWNAATRKAGYVAATLALATFAVTLVLEVALFVPGVGAPVENVQVAAIAVVLLALIAGLISLALLPGRDPLVLSEQGRQGYVYAAEITAALLFAHLYVCRPYWFNGLLRPYWPFIVMGLSFAGVGAAELFGRLRIRVLAEPLAQTGAMLPLLPVLGMWVVAAEADYALVLLVTGLLYLAVSYTRQSWAAMIAAAVAGNGALWALLSETQFEFIANPQLWLIPPALSVLVAAQVNRRRLTPEILASIRYAATIVIYVSSTSEIVTRGFAAGLAPPMVLLGLAVAGALVGIGLRVRAFLILGSTFALVALVAMVRHAAQSIDHVWPWWVFGIALGVGILVLFGVFEKKRAEVMLLIGRLRQWEQ